MHGREPTAPACGAAFTIPRDFHPATYLDHGFGPYIGSEERTVPFAPDGEWKYLREVDFPNQNGAPVPVEGGVQITLNTGFNWGMERWCRWMGMEIVSSTGSPG